MSKLPAVPDGIQAWWVAAAGVQRLALLQALFATRMEGQQPVPVLPLKGKDGQRFARLRDKFKIGHIQRVTRDRAVQAETQPTFAFLVTAENRDVLKEVQEKVDLQPVLAYALMDLVSAVDEAEKTPIDQETPQWSAEADPWEDEKPPQTEADKAVEAVTAPAPNGEARA